MGINRIGIALEMLRIGSPLGIVERTVDALVKGVRECDDAIKHARKSGDEEFLSVVVDDESDVVEQLVGVMLVTCQTVIAWAHARVDLLHKVVKREKGVDLASTDGTKSGVMKAASPAVAGSGYTKIELINAFANYYKHGDEWHHDWSKLQGSAVNTASVIVSVGASSGSSGNLRCGFHALGGKKYEDASCLLKALDEWTQRLVRLYTQEIGQLP